MLEGTIGEALNNTVARCPDRIAVQTASSHLTYRELNERSDRLASELSNLGLEPSDRVAACMGNLVEYIVVSTLSAL